MRILFAISLLFLLASCARSNDEELVRKAVREAIKAAEDKDPSAFMKKVSKKYSDNHGNDYDGVRGILIYQFMRPGNIKVVTRDLSVEVKGEEALVRCRIALLRGGEEGGAEGIRMEVVFRKEGSGWKAISAEWAEVGASGLL